MALRLMTGLAVFKCMVFQRNSSIIKSGMILSFRLRLHAAKEVRGSRRILGSTFLATLELCLFSLETTRSYRAVISSSPVNSDFTLN